MLYRIGHLPKHHSHTNPFGAKLAGTIVSALEILFKTTFHILVIKFILMGLDFPIMCSVWFMLSSMCIMMLLVFYNHYGWLDTYVVCAWCTIFIFSSMLRPSVFCPSHNVRPLRWGWIVSSCVYVCAWWQREKIQHKQYNPYYTVIHPPGTGDLMGWAVGILVMFSIQM